MSMFSLLKISLILGPESVSTGFRLQRFFFLLLLHLLDFLPWP